MRQRYNAEHDKPLTTDTYTEPLLPGPDDRDRYLIEAGARLARRLNAVLRQLVAGSLRDSHEHAADFPGFRLGVIVRAEDGHETYVAIRISGSVPQGSTALILARVPGCEPDAWFPEYTLPERELLPAEQAWSNIMDPKAAAQRTILSLSALSLGQNQKRSLAPARPPPWVHGNSGDVSR